MNFVFPVAYLAFRKFVGNLQTILGVIAVKKLNISNQKLFSSATT